MGIIISICVTLLAFLCFYIMIQAPVLLWIVCGVVYICRLIRTLLLNTSLYLGFIAKTINNNVIISDFYLDGLDWFFSRRMGIRYSSFAFNHKKYGKFSIKDGDISYYGSKRLTSEEEKELESFKKKFLKNI